MEFIKFVVLGQPQGKARPRLTTRGVYARAYTPKKTVEYEELIRFSYRSSLKASEKPIRMWINAYYSIPKSFNKAKRQQAIDNVIKPCVKPDIDNVTKCVFDALNGIAYTDDAQIIKVSCEKYYSVAPRLEITIARED